MKRGVLVLAAVAAVTAGSAAGAGPSPGVVFGSPGVVSHDGKLRYLALRAGGHTRVESVTARTGIVRRSHVLEGVFGVPLVAYDGSTGGLARTGHRLVVYAPANGRANTRFAVLDPRTLKIRSRFALAGDFGFDALSPDGSLMYLIQIKGGNGSGIGYDVRALDVGTGHLLPGAIVDRREPNEKMTGVPLTRVGSGDASWAYTLYSGSSGGAFVHALHTTAREAFCIDVRLGIADDQLGRVRMRIRGNALQLRLRGRTIATIDTRTFEVKR